LFEYIKYIGSTDHLQRAWNKYGEFEYIKYIGSTSITSDKNNRCYTSLNTLNILVQRISTTVESDFDTEFEYIKYIGSTIVYTLL